MKREVKKSDGNDKGKRGDITREGGEIITEMFSLVAKMPMVRTVLANTMEQDWEIEHVDIKSAYLNAPLKETIYMKPPRGVLKPGQEGKVLRLLKGLYGLKQAG